MDQNQGETLLKPGHGQSQIKKKIVQEEKIFTVFEEQKKRLNRMETNCKNLHQSTLHKLVRSLHY